MVQAFQQSTTADCEIVISRVISAPRELVFAGRMALEQVRAEPSPRVTHLTYTVRER